MHAKKERWKIEIRKKRRKGCKAIYDEKGDRKFKLKHEKKCGK